MNDCTIDHVLSPLESVSFFRDFWEKKAILVTHNDQNYFDRYLTLSSVDELLRSVRDEFRIIKNGEDITSNFIIPASSRNGVQSDTANVQEIIKEYLNGATVLFEGIQRRCASVARLCRSIEKILFVPVQANAYLTPPGSQGFSAHWDTHDVLILQISGTKHWKLYSPIIELPLQSQAFHGSSQLGTLPVPTDDIQLQSGDCLYIPRGIVHEAATDTSRAASLHITVGIMSYTWADLLTGIVQRISLDDVRLRKVAPIGQVSCLAEQEWLRTLLQSISSSIANVYVAQSVAEQVIERFCATRHPIVECGDLSRTKHVEVSVECAYKRRNDVVWFLKMENDELNLTFFRKRVTFPLSVAVELSHILTQSTPFTIDSLPGPLDSMAKATLVSRLIHEGLIELDTKEDFGPARK